ncbi:P-loop containing nucleoside triphosphate hydrolase protein [Coprinopsis marcescibilis]|uniref:P-loop containing nucleoside triphosphate hydrolase protein n=1 Tax=Coprinopsis marcescibilis TaxID=230819 RepID=A0A5C3L4W6_COPMA|nr:P-loop containing nucleoside triphosphate hydrolase protein [Coprinopsis marcescibilis]
MDPSEKPARKRRIAIVGSRGVDKSSLITQFVENHFVETYYPTIESTFNKVITYAGVNYDCDLIDTAGQDEYSVLSARNAVNTHAYMLVYSITSRNSLDMAVLVHEKILDFTGLDSFPCVFVGNKCHEHQSRQVSREEGRTRAKERNAAWIETSTKFNENVGETDMSFFRRPTLMH